MINKTQRITPFTPHQFIKEVLYILGCKSTFLIYQCEKSFDVCFSTLQRLIMHPQRKSAILKVFRCGPECNIAVRYSLRPALTNLGRRKPRGLEAFYGEEVVGVVSGAASGAPLCGLCAFFAFMLLPFFGDWVVMWGSSTHLDRSSVIIGAAGLDR